jgi:maltose phosphorylase
MTVHESSLSPCIHSILASKLKKEEKAYELYLRTSRLDLDDYNKEVAEGLHITSMAGTWMSIVEGMAGIRVKNDCLHLDPMLPKNWKSLRFNIYFKQQPLEIKIDQSTVEIENIGAEAVKISFNNEDYILSPKNQELFKYN